MITLAAFSDQAWLPVWQALIAAAVTIALAYMQKQTKNAVEASASASAARGERQEKKADEVKEALVGTAEVQDAKLAEITKTGHETHTLVNSNMGVQLEISAVALQRVADLTKDKDDIAAATLAKTKLAQHNEKQKTVDKQNAVASAAVVAVSSASIKGQLEGIQSVSSDTQERVKKIEEEVTK